MAEFFVLFDDFQEQFFFCYAAIVDELEGLVLKSNQ